MHMLRVVLYALLLHLNPQKSASACGIPQRGCLALNSHPASPCVPVVPAEVVVIVHAQNGMRAGGRVGARRREAHAFLVPGAHVLQELPVAGVGQLQRAATAVQTQHAAIICIRHMHEIRDQAALTNTSFKYVRKIAVAEGAESSAWPLT